VLGKASQGHGAEPEGVLSRRNHHQGNRASIRPDTEILRLQPCTEPGIVNLRLVLPKIWPQPTLNPEMIQMQLDNRNVPGEVAPDIGCADEEPRHAMAFGMCPHYDRSLLSTSEEVRRENQARGSHAQMEESTVQVPDVRRLAKLKVRLGKMGSRTQPL